MLSGLLGSPRVSNEWILGDYVSSRYELLAGRLLIEFLRKEASAVGGSKIQIRD